jgi:hypothetical protein
MASSYTDSKEGRNETQDERTKKRIKANGIKGKKYT